MPGPGQKGVFQPVVTLPPKAGASLFRPAFRRGPLGARGRRRWLAPSKRPVGVMRALLPSGHIKAPPSLPEAPHLVRGVNFRAKVTVTSEVAVEAGARSS